MPIRGRYNPFNLAAFNARLDHGLMLGLDDDDHGAIYIPYTTLASDVYTLSTASLTLTAGTLTAASVAAGQSTFTNTADYQICLAYNVATVSTLRTLSTGTLEIQSGDSTIVFRETDDHATVFIEGAKDTGNPAFIVRRAKGTTASKTAVVNNNVLLAQTIQGWDGDSWEASSQIQFIVDGAVSDGVVPGEMLLRTANAAGALTTALTLSAAQAATFASTLAAGAAVFTHATLPLQLCSGTETADFSVSEADGTLTITAQGDIISFDDNDLNTSGVLTVTGISRLDGGVGVGVDPDSNFPFRGQVNQNSGWTAHFNNTNSGSGAYSQVLCQSDTAQLTSIAHASGRVVSRCGITALGGWGEILLLAGEGLLIDTFGAGDDIVIGTEQIRAIRIDGTNQDVMIGLTDTNNVKIDTAGHMTFNGTATVWNDLQFQVSSAKVPASNFPNWEAFTTNTYEYAFDVDEYAYLMANELHHSWKEGTAANVHLHITNKTAQETAPNGDTNQYAKFTVYIAYADTDEAWQETSLTAELTIPTGTSALTNFYLDMGDLTLTNYLLEAQIKCTVKRVGATGGTEYADSVFITQVGMHLEEDTVGSNAESTK